MFIISYCITVLIAFAIIIYKRLVEEDDAMAFAISWFWPIIIAILIIWSPFALIRKIVNAIRNQNTEKIHLTYKY